MADPVTKQQFDEQGYVMPLEVMSSPDMGSYRAAFDRIEAEMGQEAAQVGVQNAHLEHEPIWELTTHPTIFDAAVELMGSDVLLLSTHFFVKYPDLADSYVAWHQDVTYWGLEPPQATTCWLAIDDADVANGCMRVIAGSHREGVFAHGAASQQGNLLSINQEVDAGAVDTSKAVDIELRAGQASFHHGHLIHGSNPNRSDRRRCGLTIRLVTPEVAPVPGDKNGALWRPILVRGEDRYHHFPYAQIPEFAK